MKWFIKGLRHYADFSGRARRREYWMFTLFNLIFAIAWLFVLALLANLGDKYYSRDLPMILNLSWCVMLALPAMAVSVRRLHDLGKSGWMLLIALIPIIGSIWLLILMASDGQPGRNIYGPDPKNGSESFSDRDKLSSAGIALIILSAISLLGIFMPYGGGGGIYTLFSLAIDGLMLTAGILLLKRHDRERARTTLKLVMTGAILIFLRGLLSWINMPHLVGVRVIFSHLHYLFIGGFLAAYLFSANEKLTRNAGLAAIVFACINLLWRMYGLVKFGNLHYAWEVISLLTIMTPGVYILLVWTFLSKREQPAVDSPGEIAFLYEADQNVVYSPFSAQTPAESMPAGSSGKGLGWKIFGLFVSIGLIIGGLSGEMVLRGTNSSEALVVAGILFLLWDIIALATHNKSGKKKKVFEHRFTEGIDTGAELALPATIRVVRHSSLIGQIVSYQVYLNQVFIGKIDDGKTLDIQTTVSHNVIMVFDHNDNPFKGDFTADLEDGGYAEVHIKAGKFINKN